MSRHNPHTHVNERRRLKRSTRISITAGIVVFLSLTSNIGFAAWTTVGTKTATATAGVLSVTTSSTLTALTSEILEASYPTLTKPITVNNTGTVAATLSGIEIVRQASSTLAGDLITVKFWAGTNGVCGTVTDAATATLSNGNYSLSGLKITIPVSGAATLCASTTFNGDIDSLRVQQSKSITAELKIKAVAKDTPWEAIDSESDANRQFTQTVRTLLPALVGTCSTSYRSIWPLSLLGRNPEATISWPAFSAPTMPANTRVTYRVFSKTGSIVTELGSTENRSFTINEKNLGSSGTITVTASAEGFFDSTTDPIQVSYVYSVLSSILSIGIRCG
jgi:hypothetical protein